MKSHGIASVIYGPQQQRNSYPSSSSSRSQFYTSSYPYYRNNSGRMENPSAGVGDRYTTGSGPYDEDFMDSPRGLLMETRLEGAVEEIDLNKEKFEREELKALTDRDQVCFCRQLISSTDALIDCRGVDLELTEYSVRTEIHGKVHQCLPVYFNCKYPNLSPHPEPAGAIVTILTQNQCNAQQQGTFLINAYRLYEDTRNHKISAGRPGSKPYITAWPAKPYLRPMYLMGATAISTVSISIIGMLVSCCACKRNPRKDTKYDIFSCICSGVLVALWALAAGLYQGMKGKKGIFPDRFI
ncbi:hypothetical protein H072_5424 [Dactylellina haptotyla CBS 200.50]|uniref:Uncharacterized protein n=1 Tax=Dactylellina haptotyla (strain CBS 200.50) TaxID=1284197 RepID=S8ACN8_DACHA|nr:hypothetical protein H072_5424 [Dactylellina haptotyla CBS 200.50]